MGKQHREALEQVYDKMAMCSKCYISNMDVNKVIDVEKGYGKLKGGGSGSFVFISQNPSIYRTPGVEVLAQDIHAGIIGQLMEMMIVLGLKQKDMLFTNAVKCSTPGNRPPTESEILACTDYLYAELQAVKPKVIIAVGRTAQQCFGDNETFHNKIPVMKIWHPSYADRSGRLKEYNEQLKEVAAECLRRKHAN